MAIKKSELYSTLWAGCDELRGGMDASQYKDYVLVLLFVKYVSDKYAGVLFAPITVPAGATFKDMVALKGKPTIGDDINKKIVGPIATANRISDVPDFNDANKLGNGKEMVDRLTRLVALFENPALNFSRNRAEGDDILGDAYEYLMRHFATESGKSKGQFYTPAEVSRVLAKVIGISPANTTPQTSGYDPTCGSGSLLLKVGAEAGKNISLFGQEMDNATAALARMNMILHNNPGADIRQGNTIANPLFLDEHHQLKTFDFVVANPPFSFKSWSNGITPSTDSYNRFKDFGSVPPEKNGDFAFLLHIVRSLKSKGKGAIILPHGVLFRGNAEAAIRSNLIDRGYIKGIIGLPANLFYGTGIPACIIVMDKENANSRRHIFMIDAGKGFLKDGNKNRLREQDIHKIVDVFTRQLEIPGYSRNVPVSEISSGKNECNLNIPRYIDSQQEEDLQDIAAHLQGGIPQHDIDAMKDYWKVYPSLKNNLFAPGRQGYASLKVTSDEVRPAIFNHPEFVAYNNQLNEVLDGWKSKTAEYLKSLETGCHPKQVIYYLGESLLHTFANRTLVDAYDVYQHLMNYAADVMQDDLYSIAIEGWLAGNEVTRLKREGKKGDKEIAGIEGLEGRLIPPALIIDVYFPHLKAEIEDWTAQRETLLAKLTELEEEHGGEEGLLAAVMNDEKTKVVKTAIPKRLKELAKEKMKVPAMSLAAEPEVPYGEAGEEKDEKTLLEEIAALYDDEAALAANIRTQTALLEKLIIDKYPALTLEEIQTVVVEKKWLAEVSKEVEAELHRISQRLAQRIKELAERYETTLPELTNEVAALEEKVTTHLQKMGLTWK